MSMSKVSCQDSEAYKFCPGQGPKLGAGFWELGPEEELSDIFWGWPFWSDLVCCKYCIVVSKKKKENVDNESKNNDEQMFDFFVFKLTDKRSEDVLNAHYTTPAAEGLNLCKYY